MKKRRPRLCKCGAFPALVQLDKGVAWGIGCRNPKCDREAVAPSKSAVIDRWNARVFGAAPP